MMNRSFNQTCPQCGASVRIRSNNRHTEVTCPRCLAEVPNPMAPRVTGPKSDCPRCRRRVADRGPFCTFCGLLTPVGQRLTLASPEGPCVICAELLPAHGGNCPRGFKPVPEAPEGWDNVRPEREAQQSSARAAYLISMVATLIGGVQLLLGASIGIGLTLIVIGMATYPHEGIPGQVGYSNGMVTIIKGIAYAILAGICGVVLCFGLLYLWCVCQSGGARSQARPPSITGDWIRIVAAISDRSPRAT